MVGFIKRLFARRSKPFSHDRLDRNFWWLRAWIQYRYATRRKGL